MYLSVHGHVNWTPSLKKLTLSQRDTTKPLFSICFSGFLSFSLFSVSFSFSAITLYLSPFLSPFLSFSSSDSVSVSVLFRIGQDLL